MMLNNKQVKERVLEVLGYKKRDIKHIYVKQRLLKVNNIFYTHILIVRKDQTTMLCDYHDGRLVSVSGEAMLYEIRNMEGVFEK